MRYFMCSLKVTLARGFPVAFVALVVVLLDVVRVDVVLIFVLLAEVLLLEVALAEVVVVESLVLVLSAVLVLECFCFVAV